MTPNEYPNRSRPLLALYFFVIPAFLLSLDIIINIHDYSGVYLYKASHAFVMIVFAPILGIAAVVSHKKVQTRNLIVEPESLTFGFANERIRFDFSDIESIDMLSGKQIFFNLRIEPRPMTGKTVELDLRHYQVDRNAFIAELTALAKQYDFNIKSR